MDTQERELMIQVVDTFLTQKVEMSRFEQIIFHQCGHGIARTGKSLIASLYSIKEGANPIFIDAVRPIIVDLKQEMPDAHIDLLLKYFPEVIKYCYTDDITSSRCEVLTKDYVDIISGVSDFTSTERILLPLGEIGIAAAFPHCCFDIVESTEIGWGIAHIISEIIDLDVRIYSPSESLPQTKYSKIIAIGPENINCESKTIEHLISCLEYNLREDEDMILLLPRKACYSNVWERLRKFLVDNVKKYLTACLSLVILRKYEVFGDECLMLITKNSPSDVTDKRNKVILGDFTSDEFFFHDSYDGRPRDIRVQAILESISKHDTEHIAVVDVDNIDRGYNFLAARYYREKALLMKPEKAEMLTELREIITISERINYIETYANNPTFKIISDRNLSENHLSCEIDLAKVPTVATDEANLVKANGGFYSFLFNKALVGKILGKDDDDTIGISDEVIHFQIKNSQRCSLDYILKELTASYAVQQAECFVGGLEFSASLSIEDFLSIQIVLPPINEQNIILLEEGKKGYSDIEHERDAVLKEFKEDMHMKKHAIGQTIFAVNNWMKLLNLARKEGNGTISDTDVIGKKHPVSVAEIFDNLEASMKRLKTQISTMDTGSQFTPKEFGVGSFIRNYISTHPRSEFQYVDLTNGLATYDLPVINDEAGDFKIAENDYILRKGDDLYFINFPEEALTIILDNIVSNACSHGFKSNEKSYYIRFKVELSGKYISLLISNNGESLHKDLDTQSIFKYGNTTSDTNDGHYGIGGYQVWKLMKDFNGTSEVISTPEDNFTVTYRLTFPLSNHVASL